MRVVVFHRGLFQRSAPKSQIQTGFPSMISYRPNQQIASGKALLQPFSDRGYVLMTDGSNLSIDVRFSYFEKAVKDKIHVPLKPWTYFSFWYRSGLNRIDILNEGFNRNNAMVAGLQHELADLAGVIGRILMLDNVALLYLRGNIPDIPGFENVTVPKHMHGTWAMADYSPKAKEFLDSIQRMRDETQTYCVYDRVNELEAQVKILTQELEQLKAQQGITHKG